MKKIMLLFLVFAMVFSVGAADFRFQRITMINEPVPAGADLRARLLMENAGDVDFENVRVTAYIYDLDIRKSIRSFDLDDNDDISSRLAMEIPEAEPGFYLVRFSASDGDGNLRRVKHRWVEII